MGLLRRLLRTDADPDSSFNFHLGTVVALVIGGGGFLFSVVGHYKATDPAASWLWAPLPHWLFKTIMVVLVLGGFIAVCLWAAVRSYQDARMDETTVWRARADEDEEEDLAGLTLPAPVVFDNAEGGATVTPLRPPPNAPAPTLPLGIEQPRVRKISG